METNERIIKVYIDGKGDAPFDEWLEGLKDRHARAVIQVRIDRLRRGNPGRHRVLGQGVFELKIDFGPGFRVYYGEEGPAIVILLCGGDKQRQAKDIARAKAFWGDFKRRIS